MTNVVWSGSLKKVVTDIYTVCHTKQIAVAT